MAIKLSRGSAITGDALSIGAVSGKMSLVRMIYRNCAVLMDSAVEMASSDLGADLPSAIKSVKIPLLGFSYNTPESMGLLKYSYSEYPFLNRSLIVNSYIKENTDFTIMAYRAITAEAGIIYNVALNELLFGTIQKYCDKGGTFTLMTLWGAFSNLVLENLEGIPLDSGNNTIGGVGFKFTFKRIGLDKSGAENIMSDSLKSLAGGYL